MGVFRATGDGWVSVVRGEERQNALAATRDSCAKVLKMMEVHLALFINMDLRREPKSKCGPSSSKSFPASELILH